MHTPFPADANPKGKRVPYCVKLTKTPRNIFTVISQFVFNELFTPWIDGAYQSKPFLAPFQSHEIDP